MLITYAMLPAFKDNKRGSTTAYPQYPQKDLWFGGHRRCSVIVNSRSRQLESTLVLVSRECRSLGALCQASLI
jgi:hypothetical protein